MKEVLDTRFFVVHLTASDPALLEKTRGRLISLRRHRQGILPSIVIAEILNLICRELGTRSAEEEYRKLMASGLKVVDLDSDLARRAGALKCRHRETPMADCIVAATALREGGRVVSDDPHFAGIPGLRVGWLSS